MLQQTENFVPLDDVERRIFDRMAPRTYFRQRVGADALQEIFHGVLGQARELGIVKDRLRLKDATHLLADISIPSTIVLVATIRDELLEAARPFAADEVKDQWQDIDFECVQSERMSDKERLRLRVAQLRRTVVWAGELTQSDAVRTGAEDARQTLRKTLARKVLADRDHPKAGDKVVSIYDPDARCVDGVRRPFCPRNPPSQFEVRRQTSTNAP